MVEKQFIVIPHSEDRGWVIGCLPKKVNILYWNKDIKITSYTSTQIMADINSFPM